MEVEVMRTIKAENTIECLDVILLGWVYTTHTMENKKLFVSTKFNEYKKNGIVVNHTAPYWAQQNGENKWQNRSLRLQIGKAMFGKYKSEIKRFLLMYNTTPHAVAKRTPTEFMFGRTI